MTNLRKLTNHEPHIVVWQKWMASRTKTVPGAELSKKNPSCLVALGPGLTAHGLWPRLQIFTMRSALDEELYLVHPKAQIAGLKRAQMAALKGLVWLPPRGCLETCLRWLRCHHSERFSCGFSGTKSSSFFFCEDFWCSNLKWKPFMVNNPLKFLLVSFSWPWCISWVCEGFYRQSVPTEERVAKADLRGKRGRKNDTFVTTSSLDAARCAVGGWKTEGERGGSWFPFQNIKPELYCHTCEHLQQNWELGHVWESFFFLAEHEKYTMMWIL